MSACNNFTPRAVGVGPRDDVCLNCPFPEEAHPAPLSPIALDFEAARRSARVGPHGEEDERITEHHLNAQLRAIVARVAQEEREKAFKEVRARIVDDGNPALIREWIDVQLRGTP